MKKGRVLTQQQFDDLLNWLSVDRETAGEIYVTVSDGLTRYFRIKGCSDTPGLVDETINRVARNLNTIDISHGYKPITIFYGYAKNVYFEYLEKTQRAPISLDTEGMPRGAQAKVEDGSDPRFSCLDTCVNGLGEKESHFVVAYFEKAGEEKVKARRELAQQLNISIETLHVRIHRLKDTLRKCLEKCLESL